MPWQSFRLHAFHSFIYSFIYLEEGNGSVMSHRLWRMDNLSDSADAAEAGAAVTAFLLFLFLPKKKKKINCSFQLICRLHSWEMATEDGDCTTQLQAWLAVDIQCTTNLGTAYYVPAASRGSRDPAASKTSLAPASAAHSL